MFAKPWLRQWSGRIVAVLVSIVLVVTALLPGGGAQTTAPQADAPPSAQPAAEGTPAAPAFKPEELEQIAAPIALYPDPLLAQIFMASTYPVEIVQAARFAQANPSLKGDQLNEELKKHDWDDSVKSLVSFPDVLTMMDQKLDWTEKLGDAVLGQQKELMDAIQRLRAKAQASGNLKTTEQQKVTVEPAAAPAAAPAPGTPPPSSAPPPQIITIEPANPQMIYVPTYQPTVVYGGWPYPAYPPYSYYPPGYVAGAALSFGVGMAVGAAVWGGCNWGHGEVDVDVDRQSNFNRNVNRTSNTNTQRSGQRANAQGGKQNWQHDPSHRKGQQYRDTATQQRYNKQGAPNAASREAYRGRAEQGRQEMARSGGAGAGTASGANRAAPRDSGQLGAGGGARGGAESASPGSGGRAGGGEARAAAGGGGGGQARSAGAGAGGGSQARSAAAAGGGGQRAGGAAFEGAGQGRAAQSYSQRGGSSMSSARASGFQGGGGGARAGGGGGGGRGGRR